MHPSPTAPHAPADAPDVVAQLNRDCAGGHLDADALRQAFDAAATPEGGFDAVRARCPHLFAAAPVFVAATDLQRMAAVVRAVHEVAALPAWREAVLADAPAAARVDPRGPLGVFHGFDFHAGPRGFGLIEINTNAGGALLNARMARAQRGCCAPMDRVLAPGSSGAAFEDRIVAMFRREWALAGHARPLHRIALVDESPATQYLYPEFLLFQQLFRAQGWDTVIADPSALEMRGGRLCHDGPPIDLVYDRLTDFHFDAPASAALRQAWEAHAAVITPHPRAHALLADKRRLALLSDEDALRRLGVPPATREVLLAGVPRTEVVDASNAARLWADRRHLFFKPFAGYGSRAAWRGDKLTRRTWEGIVAGGHVAQAFVPPAERWLPAGAAGGGEGDRQVPAVMKVDLRAYVYDGEVQWTAARLYQGQATNFRTPGGGFARVLPVPAAPDGLADVACEDLVTAA